jgi:hypothetical protein
MLGNLASSTKVSLVCVLAMTLEPGRRYVIRWLDDSTEYLVTFIKTDRGFFIFEWKKSSAYLVARPSAVAIRPA